MDSDNFQMKWIMAAFFTGLLLLYFVTAALKIDIFNWETAIHSAIRFCTGFAILGIGVFYAHQIQLKIALAIIFTLFLTDDLLDYLRHVETFTAEYMLYGVYMLSWGAAIGYLTGKYYHHLKA